MKIVITGGVLEAEVVRGTFTLDDVRGLLKNLTKAEIDEIVTTENIKTAGVSPHSSKSNMQDKLRAKPRMPI